MKRKGIKNLLLNNEIQYLYKIKSKTEKPLKILASLTFMISSVIITYMVLSGKIIMDENQEYAKNLRMFIFSLSSKLSNPILDIVVLIVIILLFWYMFREANHESKKK